ncbi:MAG: YwmB family TATA-box binding protein [Dethiobacter sp.]|nr:YwmB family TATA-box binding protein [Dethiobacter sp.]MCL4463523.1 YwmB family TATA-box binding protein [Bacillota bacterium]MCL5994197.1 YwmB family TATA-box binding protein [Bacillota bacterium]
MNWRKKAVVLVCLVSLLVIVSRAGSLEMGEVQVLEALLSSAGAEIVAGEVQFYAILDDDYRTMAELEEIIFDVGERLRLEGGEVQQGEGETYRVLEVTGLTAFGPEVQLVVQSNPGAADLGSSPQTYLLIVSRNTSPEKIKTMVTLLNQQILPLAPQGQISVYLTGQLPGKRTAEEMGRIARRALRIMGAREVEGIEGEELISLTAYTPLLNEDILIDGQRFNLNLAVRYDDFHEKTLLWAGFPVIHGTY